MTFSGLLEMGEGDSSGVSWLPRPAEALVASGAPPARLPASYKGYAMLYDLYKIVAHIFEARAMGSNAREGK